MYTPKHFALDDLSSQHDLIDACDFGIVVSSGAEGLFATHIPMMLRRDEGEFGVLYGHMARPNPHVGLFGFDAQPPLGPPSQVMPTKVECAVLFENTSVSIRFGCKRMPELRGYRTDIRAHKSKEGS